MKKMCLNLNAYGVEEMSIAKMREVKGGFGIIGPGIQLFGPGTPHPKGPIVNKQCWSNLCGCVML